MTILDFICGRSRVVLAAGALYWLSGLAGGSLRAGDVRSFALGNKTVAAEEITDEVPVLYRTMRFNEATEQWNVELVVTNRGERSFTQALFLTIESVANTTGLLSTDGVSTNIPSKTFLVLDPNGVLEPGKLSRPRTVALGFTGSASAPRLQMRVFGIPSGSAYALGLTRSLNEVGQPLTRVRVTERGPVRERVLSTDPDYGVVTLGQSAGEHTWTFERDGYLPVWRKQSLLRGAVKLIPNPRLTPRSPDSTLIAAGTTNIVQDPAGGVRLKFSVQQSSESAVVTLTLVDGQTLPALLPQGWSPMRAFWVESTNAPLNASITLRPEGHIPPTETAVLARWNPEATQWETKSRLTSDGTNVVGNLLTDWGAYALVVADTGPLAPPASVVGQPLLPSSPPAQPFPALDASGTVTPSSSPASGVAEQVTATAFVLVTNKNGLLPSGLNLRTEVTEDYRLQDSSTRFMAFYETFVTAYRRPAGTSPTALGTTFPMRPLLLFGGNELASASVRMEVLSPDIFRGGIFDSSGGLVADDRIRVRALGGEFATPQAALLRSLTSTNLPSLLIAGQAIAASFDLTVASVEPGRHLSLQVSKLATNQYFILSRILSGSSFNGIEPVERLQSGTNGKLTSLEPATGDRLPGLRGAGQYVLVQVNGPHGLISGIARNAQNQPAAGLPIHITGQPWLTFSASNGAYRLVAPAGSVQVVATDLASGDSDFRDSTVVDPGSALVLNLGTTARGPRVASVSPVPGSRNVSRVTPIVVTFTEPVNPGTVVGGGLRLFGTNGQPISASLTLNQRGTIATLLPADPLAPGQTYGLQISTNLAGLNGRTIEGGTQYSFSTVPEPVRDNVAKLTIFEPGATNIPVRIRSQLLGFNPSVDRQSVVAAGSPGTAESEVPVILVNETSGETATVLSKLDGSFAGFVHAAEEDLINAVFVNANGSRTTIPATLQRFDDGRLALYQPGGILEAESGGRPVQIVVEPGSINNRTRFKIDVIPLARVLAGLGNVQPEGGKVLGGVAYSEELDPIKAAADISFPVDVADIPLPPGADPSTASFALTIPTEISGLKVFQVVDTMQFQPDGEGKGRLVTQSPPFVGLLLRQIEALRQNTRTPNILARFTGNPLSQFAVQPVLGAMLIPIFMAAEPPAKIAGKVYAVPAEITGPTTTEATAVAGAFVRLRRSAVAANPFAAGDIFAISERDGRYALAVGGAAGFLVATHPSFPFQEAKAQFGDALVLKADIFFQKNNGPISGVRDTVAPILRVTQSPASAGAGVGIVDGALLSVTAIDDFQVSDIQVLKEDFRTLGGDAPLDAASLRDPEFVDESPGDGSRRTRSYRLRAAQPGRAEYIITATDPAGNQSSLAYPVTFRSSPGTITGTSNRVLLAWPPDQSTNVPAGDPILLRFSQPLTTEQITDTSWLRIGPAGAYIITGAVPSADRREMTIHYANSGSSATAGTLTLEVGTEDAMSLATGGTNSGAFSYRIELAPSLQTVNVVPGIGAAAAGRGAVLVGNFVYQAGVRGDQGVVQQFRFTGPHFPGERKDAPPQLEWVSEVTFPGRPSELVYVPRYALRRGDGTPLDPASYLVVFDGAASDAKVVRLFRIAPVTGALAAFPGPNGFITTEPAQVVKAKWDPPFIGFFELGADVTSVKLLNLNALFVGLEARATGKPLSIFPDGGRSGVDTNEDGDFADDNEKAPLPDGRGIGGLGVEFSFAPFDRNDRIADFDFSADFALVATVVRGINGRTNALVMRLGGGQGILEEESAKVAFPEEPKRVLLLTRQKLIQAGGIESEFDLALVSTVNSTNANVGGDGVLIVVNVSNPAHPVILGRARMPRGAGSLNSVIRREDGLLALASSGGGLILLDPRLLLQTVGGEAGFSAAVQSTAAGLGSPVRAFVADDAGYHITGNGPHPTVAYTDPDIRIVTFPAIAPFDPRALVDPAAPRPAGILAGEEGLQNLLYQARAAGSPRIAQLESETGVADPESHLYVLVRAPGITGAELRLAAAAVNSLGQPILPNTDIAVPTFLGEDKITARFALLTGLEILKNASFKEASFSGFIESLARGSITEFLLAARAAAFSDKPTYPGDLTARRLSDDPTCPLFNTYMAGPIVLLKEDLTKDRFTQIDRADTVPSGSLRRYLRASAYCWVGLGVSLNDDALLGRFASQQGEDIEVALNFHFPNLFGLGFAAAQAAVTGNFLPLIPAIAKFIDARLVRMIHPGINSLVNVGCIRRPLVIIPGVMGSKLRGSKSEKLWLDPSNAIFQDDLEKLVLAADGRSTFVEPYEIFDELLGTDAGAAMIKHLQSTLAYRLYELDGERSLRLDGMPNTDSLGKMPDLFLFPYDWRLDNAETAARLKKYFDLIRSYHPDGDRIDIIAHSMGGLVARRFILENPEAVDRLITIASPLLGATKAVAAKRLGDFDDLALNIAVPQRIMKKIARHNPALDQLMPSKALFDLGLRPVGENGWDADDDCLPYETYEYADYKRVLDGFLYHAQAEDFPAPPNLYPDPRPIGGPNNNEAFHSFPPGGSLHNTQDDWSGDTSSTRYTHIVALQRNRSTISRVRLTPALRELAPEEGADVGLGFPPLNFAETENVALDIPVASADDPQFPSARDVSELSLSMVLDRGPGDSTVPFLSQTRGYRSARDLNAPGTLIIPVISKDASGASDKATSHVGVLKDDRCLDWVSRVLREKVTSQMMASVNITVSGNLTEGGEMTFNASASIPGGSFAKGDFIWDTGDSDMFIGQSGSHTYVEDGVYTLTCAVATSDGRFAGLASKTVTISNGAPAIVFDRPPDAVQVGTAVTFRTIVTDPGLRDPHRFTWNFGDGSDPTVVPADAFATRHFFKEPGPYTVTVSVEDEDGASATSTHLVTVTPTAPPAAGPLRPRAALASSGQRTSGDLISVDEATILVRGHTAEADDFAIFHDGKPLFDVTGRIVRFVKGLLLPVGPSAEQIVVRREPEQPGGPLPTTTLMRVKADGREVTLEALVRFTSGQSHCFRWLLGTTKNETVELTLPWNRIPTLQDAALSALTSPTDTFAARINCLDVRGTTETVVRDELAQEIQVFRFDETIPDGDPTEIDTELDAAQPAPRTDTLITQVDPIDPCAQSDNLLAVSLSNGKIPITAASGTPQLVVVKDKRGNVTVTSNVHRPVCDDVQSPTDFTPVRDEIMAIFREAVNDPVAKDFLLSINDMWIFEQGSGAALWKGDDVKASRIYGSSEELVGD